MRKITEEEKKLFKAVEKVYPTEKLSRKEYKGGLLLMDLKKGGNFNDMKYRWFNKAALTGDMFFSRRNYPVQFVFKLVGLKDVDNPNRNWGVRPEKLHNYSFKYKIRMFLFNFLNRKLFSV